MTTELIGYAAGLLLTLYFLPQVIKTCEKGLSESRRRVGRAPVLKLNVLPRAGCEFEQRLR